MDIDGHKLMMLFVVADERGKGAGSKLLEYGIAAHAISEFTVNGQSPQAIGPYKHRGLRSAVAPTSTSRAIPAQSY